MESGARIGRFVEDRCRESSSRIYITRIVCGSGARRRYAGEGTRMPHPPGSHSFTLAEIGTWEAEAMHVRDSIGAQVTAMSMSSKPYTSDWFYPNAFDAF